MTDPAPASSRARWQAGVGVLVSAALLVWAMRGLDPADVWRQATSARPLPLLGAIVLATGTFPLRALRWRALLVAPDGTALPWAPRWHAVAVGFMANNLLPFRAGEFLRCFVVNRLTRVPIATAITSVAAERLFDAVFVLGLFAVGLAVGSLPPSASLAGRPLASLATATGLLAGIGIAGGVTLLLARGLTERLVRLVIRRPALAERALGLVAQVRDGFGVLRDPARAASALGWSLVLWLVNAASFLLAAWAFDLPLDWTAALVIQAVIGFGVALPSTPGFIGVFEAAVVAVLGLYGIPQERAFAYGLTYHLTTFAPIIVLGLLSLSRTSIGFGELRRQQAGG